MSNYYVSYFKYNHNYSLVLADSNSMYIVLPFLLFGSNSVTDNVVKVIICEILILKYSQHSYYSVFILFFPRFPDFSQECVIRVCES